MSAPESAAVESKISSGVVVFVRDFPPYQTRDVLRIFNRTFALTKLQCVQICESSLAGSNLPFVPPEILRGKGRLVGDFAFSRASPR